MLHAHHPSSSTSHLTQLNFNHNVIHPPPDYTKLIKYFAYLPVDVIKRTFALTTQWARHPASTLLKRHFKSPWPAFNVPRRNEDVATDTIFSDTPAIDNSPTNRHVTMRVFRRRISGR